MSTRDQGKEKSLQQSEDMFRLLFETVADALFLHDLEGRFIEVNQAACDSLGYTREELLQLPFLSIVKDQDPEALGNLWARVLQGEKLTAQAFHQRRDGATFPVEVHLSPFEYEGRPHILAAARDITGRREAEKAIQASVEKHRRLQANIPGMVYMYALHPDGSFSFPYANAASRELFDVAPADLMRDGALLAGLIHPDDRERRDEAIRRSAAILQPFREELRHIVNGKVRWYDVMSRPEPQPNGDILWDGIMLEITGRKRAEAALAESEQRFSTFMEHLPVAVFIKDQEGRLLFANRYLQETFGWEDCLGKTTEELLPREMAARMIEDDQRVLAAGPVVIQERITDVQGEEHFFDTYKFPIMAEGSPVLLGGIAVDVTAGRRAIKALELSEQKYRSFYESILDGFASVDLDGNIVETNQAFLEMIGYTAAEVRGLRYHDLTPAKWHRFEADIIEQQVLTRGYSDTYEKEYIRKDGTVFPIELRTYLIKDETGAPGGMWAFIRDITERRRVEQELLHIKFAFDNVSAAIGMSTKDGQHFYQNQAFDRLFGYSTEEIGELQPAVVYGSKNTAREVFATIMEGNSWKGEIEMVTKSGRHFPVTLHADAIKDANGNIVGLIGIHTDISDRKHAEEALQKEKLLTEALLDSLPGTFFLLDSQGQQLRTNRSGLEVSGYSWEELSNMHALESIAAEDRPAGQRALAEVLEKGEASVEAQMLTKDGRKIPFLFTAKKFIIDGVPFILGTGLDITKRKEAEEALQESEERFRRLSAAAFEAIIIHEGGILLNANDQYYEMFGYEPEELLGKQALPLTVAPEAIESMRKNIAAGSLEPYESIGLKKDWTKFPMEIRIREMEYEGRKVRVAAIMDITERRRAEEALRESEERYRSLFQNNHAVMLLVDPETGAIMDANPAACAYYGFSKEELLAKKTTDINTLAPKQVLQEMQRAKTEKRKRFEFQHRLANGEVREVVVFSGPIRIKGRELLYSIIHDVTGRKEAEKALQESEQRFRSLVETTSDWVWEIDENGLYTYASPKVEDLLGYRPNEVIGKSPLDFMPPDEAKRINAVLQDLMKSHEPISGLENINLHKTGRQVLLETSGVPVFGQNGVFSGFRGIDRDITQRKQAEEGLRDSETRFRQVVEHSPMPIAIVKGDQGEYLNPKFVETLGYTLEDLPRLADWFRLAYPDPDYRQIIMEKWQKAMEEAIAGDQTIQSLEVHVTCKDGSVRTMEIWGILLGGKTIFFCTDLTARKRAEEEQARLEEQMREVQKLESLGVLAGGIAHDFNNLLMAILGNADLALLSLSPASPAHPKLEHIVRASQRAADLCGQMLAYSGKGRFVVGRYDLSEIVQEMAQMLKVSVSKKVALRYFFAADLPAVEVDATQMRQVIMNLITNASEALGDQSGFISVSTGVMDCDRAYLAESYLDDKLPEGKYVYLEVADTGSGIDEETRRRIFDPFFTTKFTGRGLGLAAVLGIVRGHQGAIKVYSEVGQGTTFKVLLPAREWAPGDRGPSAAQSVPPLSRGGTILLVDDDPEVRDVGSQMLERLGFKVLTAAHGREGLKVFREYGGEIDCVILDLTMPEMGGEEVFRELRRLRSNVRVILSSGYNEQEVTQRFAGKGLAGFIQKPYRVVNIQEVLNRVFG